MGMCKKILESEGKSICMLSFIKKWAHIKAFLKLVIKIY